MIKRQIKGVVHWCERSKLIRSRGRRIEQSFDKGESFQEIGEIDFGWLGNIAGRQRLASRLARAEIKHIVPLEDPDKLLVVACKKNFCLDTVSGKAEFLGDVVGSHPLRICRHGSGLFYGEYRSNPERTPINVWGSSTNGTSWESVFQFRNIRHVHGVFFDSVENCFWVTTGDNNDEAAVWRIETNWEGAEKIFSGSQQSRIIDLLFSPTCIFFGTDAPHEQNWICSMDRKSREVRQIAPVDGTVFHAKKSRDEYYFSTACEPGMSSREGKVDLLRLTNLKLEKLLSLKKDCWSMKYFQYGQIRFASGTEDKGEIWISPLATNYDQCSLLLESTNQSQV